MKGGGKMADAQQINDFLVDAFGRINKIEERAMTTGLGSAISITEIHIIEKIGLSEPARMSEIAHMLGVTLATMTVACDKLEEEYCIQRIRMVLNRVRPQLISHGKSGNIDDAMDEAGLPLLGLVPEDVDLISCSNSGRSIHAVKHTGAARAFVNIARRLNGERIPLKL